MWWYDGVCARMSPNVYLDLHGRVYTQKCVSLLTKKLDCEGRGRGRWRFPCDFSRLRGKQVCSSLVI